MEYEGDDCECSMTSSSLAIVFSDAKKFNADLSSWDVSLVNNMDYSKLCAVFVSVIR
jgi:surface protein